jgi:hypothetical protein
MTTFEDIEVNASYLIYDSEKVAVYKDANVVLFRVIDSYDYWTYEKSLFPLENCTRLGRKRVMYANIYTTTPIYSKEFSNVQVSVFDSREAANRWQKDRVACVKVEFREGQLDE